jgi:hypothetical protein
MRRRCDYCTVGTTLSLVLYRDLGVVHPNCARFLDERRDAVGIPVWERQRAVENFVWGSLRAEIEAEAAERAGKPLEGDPFEGIRELKR